MHLNLETKRLDFHQPMAAIFDLAIAGPRGQFRIVSTSETAPDLELGTRWGRGSRQGEDSLPAP